MYVTTVYDLAKDCNMMLDKNLIDCFEEVKIDSEQLDELIENYNLEQQLGIINTTRETSNDYTCDTLNNQLPEKISNKTNNDIYSNKNNYEKLNKNKIHNYLYPNNEKKGKNSDKINSRNRRNDTSIERDENCENRTNRPSVKNKKYSNDRNNRENMFKC